MDFFDSNGFLIARLILTLILSLLTFGLLIFGSPLPEYIFQFWVLTLLLDLVFENQIASKKLSTKD